MIKAYARAYPESHSLARPHEDMAELSWQYYEFGPFRLDARRRRLIRGSSPIPLTPKVFETLLMFVRNSGRDITKDELLEAIWPDSYVEESNLVQNVFVLRRALGEEISEHQYIVTVPGRGYRFVAQVKKYTEASAQCGRLGDSGLAADTDRVTTVAVLPFKALTLLEGEALLAVGLADALITRLSGLRRISVRPTGAVLRYAEHQEDPLAAGRELGVELVLDGIYQRDGNHVRVTVQAIRVSDGTTIWAEKFNEEFTNFFLFRTRFRSRPPARSEGSCVMKNPDNREGSPITL